MSITEYQLPSSREDQPQRSSEDWEAYIGQQCREQRLRRGLDQLELAAQANISVGALKHLEGGKGCTLRTLVRVIRVLEREDWLEALAPAVAVSPLQQLRAGQQAQPRQRVYRPRTKGSDAVHEAAPAYGKPD